jgi:hypothetical protein
MPFSICFHLNPHLFAIIAEKAVASINGMCRDTSQIAAQTKMIAIKNNNEASASQK